MAGETNWKLRTNLHCAVCAMCACLVALRLMRLGRRCGAGADSVV